MKQFLTTPMAIFIGTAALLNLGSLGLMLVGNISFTTFLQSLSLITMGVFTLYQVYTKGVIITEVNQILANVNQIKDQNDYLRKANSELLASLDSFQSKDIMNKDDSPKQVVSKSKRKYTKKEKR
jgi:chromosome condensin MukBEF MukE localization factor